MPLIWRTFLVLSFTFSSLLADAHCDFPGKAFLNRKVKTQDECKALCEAESKCQSWVFVSHWNNCALKDHSPKKRTVRFMAQTREEPLKVDHDYTAKDMKNLGGTKNAEECFSSCQKDEKCSGVTYIDGYQSCWLKTGPGRTVPKIMYCGKKK
jgi:hypothetical protein